MYKQMCMNAYASVYIYRPTRLRIYTPFHLCTCGSARTPSHSPRPLTSDTPQRCVCMAATIRLGVSVFRSGGAEPMCLQVYRYMSSTGLEAYMSIGP